MQATTDDDPSLTEILYALIPALILFLESILANPVQTPSTRRYARYLRHIRALAVLFGVPTTTPTAQPAHPRRLRAAAPNPRPAPTPPTPQGHPPHTPEPTRTLEL